MRDTFIGMAAAVQWPEALRRAVKVWMPGVLIVLAASGFYWMPSGSAQSWPAYVLVLFLPWHLVSQPRSADVRRSLLCLQLLLIWCVLTALWRDVPAAAQVRLMGVVVCLYAWVVVCIQLGSDPQPAPAAPPHRPAMPPTVVVGWWHGAMRQFQGLYYATLLLAALGSIVVALWLTLPEWTSGTRLGGWSRLTNPAVAGVVWGLAAIVALRVLRKAPLRPLAYLGLAVLLAVFSLAVLLTQTRAAIIVLVVLMAAAFRPRRHLLRFTLLAIIASASALALIVWSLDIPTLTGGPRGLVDNPRFAIWQHVLGTLQPANWVVGIGAATAQTVALADGSTFDHAHGALFSILRHAGVPGLVLLLGILGFAFRHVLRLRNLSLTADIALWTLAWGMLTALFDGGSLIDKINHQWLLIWTPLAFALAESPAQTTRLEHAAGSHWAT